ncbi:MAG: hypothetical protein R3Y53_07680 [Bacillota bacterium]
MKSYLRKMAVCSLALAMTVGGVTTAFATTEEEIVEEIELEDGKPYLSVAEAVEKANKASWDLYSMDKTIDYLSDKSFDIWDSYYGWWNKSQITGNQQYVDAVTHSVGNAIMTLDNTVDELELTQQKIELGNEATVKNYFSAIAQMEASVRMLEANLNLQKLTESQTMVQLIMGQVSQNTLDQTGNDIAVSELNVIALQQQIDQMYTTLNNLIDEPTDNRYTLEKVGEFTPYEKLTETEMKRFISNSMKKDLTVLQTQADLEAAKIATTYMSTEITDDERDENAYNLQNAYRAEKRILEEKDIAIRAAYTELAIIEQSYEQALLNLKIAEDNVRVVEINVQVGNLPKIQLEQVKLSLLQSENELEQLAYSYDMQVFMLENSSLLS